MKTIKDGMKRLYTEAQNLMRRLLDEDDQDFFDYEPRRWLELSDMDDEQWEEYLDTLIRVWLFIYGTDEHPRPYGLDTENFFLIAMEERDPSFRFETQDALNEFLEYLEHDEDFGHHGGGYTDDFGEYGSYGGYGDPGRGFEGDTTKHIYKWEREPDAPKYTLEQKKAHQVFEHGDFIFLKLPTDPDFIRREGISMQHCFVRETKIITYAGTGAIGDLVGRKVKVLSRGVGTGKQGMVPAWYDAEIQSFGIQPIVELVLTRYRQTVTLRTTAGHRWFVYPSRHNRPYRNNGHKIGLAEKVTSELEAGNIIPSIYAKQVPFASESPKGINLSPVGVMHGIVFGDGSIHGSGSNGNRSSDGNRPSEIPLFGKKDAELLSWFPAAVRKDPITRSIGGVILRDLPRYFKKLPPLDECSSYLMGWLAGYFAADGNVNAEGCGALHSASRENLEFAEMLCQRFGIRTAGIRSKVRIGFGGVRPIHRLAFCVGNLPSDFFLLSEHRARIKPRIKACEDWQVKSITRTKQEEEVFCAVVPETGCFALEGNILTRNCLSVAHKDYCRRMLEGEIEVYSMTDTRDGEPKVDIEVALTKGSYSRAHGAAPTVTQVRGLRNQVPPADEYLVPLMAFFQEYGEAQGWRLSGHGVKNFDGRVDGDLLIQRWQQLQGEQ